MLVAQEPTHPEDESRKIRMLRWMREHTRKDRVSNMDILDKVGVAFVVDKMGEQDLYGSDV